MQPTAKEPRRWTLNKLVVFVLMLGFCVLLIQVRYDHRSVIGENAIGWIPIVFSIVIIVVSLFGLLFWRRGGRQVLKGFYLLAIVVGFVGYWYHTNGKVVRAVQHDLSAWVRKIPDEDKPPAFAPLAFAGFGVLGLLACARRFQTPTADESAGS
jgi:energy-coupling factor transporter transmembrane protein EcfT